MVELYIDSSMGMCKGMISSSKSEKTTKENNNKSSNNKQSKNKK